jgi:hypothetical protein
MKDSSLMGTLGGTALIFHGIDGETGGIHDGVIIALTLSDGDVQQDVDGLVVHKAMGVQMEISVMVIGVANMTSNVADVVLGWMVDKIA